MYEETDIPSLVAALALEEKAELLSGRDGWATADIERLGIPSIMLTDGPHGLRKQDPNAGSFSFDVSLPATCFPTAAALGSSWDVDLLTRVGAALGAESSAADVAVLLGPGVNIKRSPLCGRNFEYLSEDPVISGRLGAALVQGVQSRGVGASVKHFAVNNQETDRMRVSAEVDVRTLREIYLAGFEHVVTTAKPWTVMAAYNRVNGVHAAQNGWLLTEVLREEWGFDGLSVGASSRDLRLTSTVTVDAPALTQVLTWESSVGDWLAHSSGAPVLLRALNGMEGSAVATDPEILRMVESLPLSRLITMTGGRLDTEDLSRFLDLTQGIS